MKIKREVKKWGNSGGIQLPKQLIGKVLILELRHSNGQEVILRNEGR
jgi:antitoxin component of MazEF toxin-antitoxin module